MQDKTPIGHIHAVPVYGRLPQRFVGLLPKIEAITSPNEWSGLSYIVCCDEDIDTTVHQNIAGGMYLRHAELNVKYSDGTEEYFYIGEGRPVIYIEGGLHRSDYWFAFDFIHELGHHNDPDLPIEAPTVEAELFAHTFALNRVIKDDFQFEDETPPMYYKEANAIWDRENKQ
ncbi:hypothetical protein D3P07_12065 [Paenibacillus sp. 1011MAR3C5]|uniref:hypothetical protein n=1 Tax=Paenibacillus sp. 1011MAR3C5 TaxID=1675787 RepID=UPI000E6C6AE8|nr:hypothetical protein [Paenibacillus sp. 1011MAR3C5]RJE88716.1 hypothetical protein D3P07_12065 [Paenibacillus sp. 1011MAR3C5]